MAVVSSEVTASEREHANIWQFWSARFLEGCPGEVIERQVIASLSTLHRVNLELSRMDSPDTLCRCAIELGITHLGFDRMAIWMLAGAPDRVVGTYGVDEDGRLRDERGWGLTFEPESPFGQVLARRTVVHRSGVLLSTRTEISQLGEHTVVPIRNIDQIIGFLCADNLLSGLPLTTSQSQFLELYGDIIGHLYAQKRALSDLQLRQEYIRLIENNIRDVIWVSDLDLQLEYISPSVQRLQGFSVEEMMRVPLNTSLTPNSFDLARAVLQEELAQEAGGYADPMRSRKLEVELFHKDGSTLWAEVNMTFLRDTDGAPRGILGVTRDISRRLQAEKHFRTSEAKFRSLVDHLPAVTYMAVLEDDCPTLYVSPQIESMLGFTPEAWTGDPSLYFRQIHPDDLQRVLDEITVCQQTGKPFTMEYRIHARDGLVVWVHDEAVLLQTDEGDFHQGVMLDITARKQAEESEQLLRHMQESERLKSEFLSLTSHELKTPLTPIRGAIDLLRDEIVGPLNEQQRLVVQMADRQTRRLQRQVDDLLVLFSIDSGQLSLDIGPVDLRRTVTESISAYQQRFTEKGLSLCYKFLDEIPMMQGDAQRLGQILDNLLYNALKYTEHGTVTVHLSANADFILLSVADTGIGIPPDQLASIFQRFYQVDGLKEGAGLGLAIVKHFVQAHGGQVRVESALGKGSNFSVELPVHREVSSAK